MGIFRRSGSGAAAQERQQQQQEQRSDDPWIVLTKLPVLTPPLSLDRDDRSSPDEGRGAATRILELFKGVGSDLTRFQVPVSFNMPKSQLQLYGETLYCFGGSRDLLSECAAAGSSPEDRFLAVLRWHISTTRPAPFGKAPYNPVLGETHHVSVGDLNVFLEQVSHHPPISALHATNEKAGIQFSCWQQPSPKFYGSGVEITINGNRTLQLDRFDETYNLTSPKLGYRFIPVPLCEWTGTTTIECAQTGLRASICFKSRGFFGRHDSSRKISGKVWDTNTGRTLHEVHGHWDQVVYLQDPTSGATSVLYEAKEVLTNVRAPRVEKLHAASPMESVIVWSVLSEGILHRDFDKARAAKLCVEEQQRALRKQRLACGNTWSPKFFQVSSSGGWEWQHAQQPVPQAPIVVQLHNNAENKA